MDSFNAKDPVPGIVYDLVLDVCFFTYAYAIVDPTGTLCLIYFGMTASRYLTFNVILHNSVISSPVISLYFDCVEL